MRSSQIICVSPKSNDKYSYKGTGRFVTELCQIPEAAIINYNKLSGLKKAKSLSFYSLEARNPKSRCQKGYIPFVGPMGESFPASSSFWQLHMFFGLWLSVQSLFSSLYCFILSSVFYSFVCHKSPCSFVRIFVIRFGAHADNLG